MFFHRRPPSDPNALSPGGKKWRGRCQIDGQLATSEIPKDKIRVAESKDVPSQVILGVKKTFVEKQL